MNSGAARAAAGRCLDVLIADWRANRSWGGRALILGHRFAHATLGLPKLLLLATGPFRFAHHAVVRVIYAANISARVDFAPGVEFRHTYGIGIHPDAVIEQGCVLRHGTTIGARRMRDGTWGVPTLRRGVDVGAGAMLLGGIEIGERAVVGAGAVVLRDVPAGRVAVGNPARLLPDGRSSVPSGAPDPRTVGRRSGSSHCGSSPREPRSGVPG